MDVNEWMNSRERMAFSWGFRNFCLCQYPFIVSLGRKMDIMEVDARRQMEREMKDALLSVLYQKRFKVPFLTLKVRREHILEDSLNQVSLFKN
jgi:hypothetical protein